MSDEWSEAMGRTYPRLSESPGYPLSRQRPACWACLHHVEHQTDGEVGGCRCECHGGDGWIPDCLAVEVCSFCKASTEIAARSVGVLVCGDCAAEARARE